jgi:uncharacterized protein YbjT (DUF2867 family)
MTVAVIGATGNVGPHVVASLLACDADVRVLTRDERRAAGLLPAGVDIRETDIRSHDAVRAAAEGAESLLLLTSHASDMADVQLRIVRAIRGSGIRIVKISGTSSAITPDGPYACREHWEVEVVLRAAGDPYVILRPNAYMQTIIGQLLQAVQDSGVVPNAIAASGLSMIDARDVADCAAVALTSSAWDGETFALTGPRPVTYANLAELIGEKQGRTTKLQEITPADVRATMLSRGMQAWEADHFAEMYQLFRDGRSQHVTDDVAKLSGHDPRTVEAYLAEALDRDAGEQAGVGR